MRLENKVSLVTGASSGIGRAIALAMAKEAAGVALAGRDVERLAKVSDEAGRGGAQIKSYRGDLASDEQVLGIANEIRRDFGSLDILIHSAGLFRMGTVSEAPLSDFDLLYQTNVRGPYLLTRAFLDMLVARQGQIVFINSSVGLAARAGVGAYAASKHALKAIADSLRAEVNPMGVRVISIYPGRTATPQQEKIYEMEGRQYEGDRLLQPQDVARAVLDALSMPRSAEVTDVSIRPMQKS
jgi:NADP-dependent 3-hydroxy acid dehydrogenase YdfG